MTATAGHRSAHRCATVATTSAEAASKATATTTGCASVGRRAAWTHEASAARDGSRAVASLVLAVLHRLKVRECF